MQNQYGQKTEKCIYYNKICGLNIYRDTCVICKGQFCRRYDDRNAISLSDLADKIGLNKSTLYSYLGNYRFDRYKIKNFRPEKYLLCQGLINNLVDFLYNKIARNPKLIRTINILEKMKLNP